MAGVIASDEMLGFRGSEAASSDCLGGSRTVVYEVGTIFFGVLFRFV